jgi:hypothetical protein
MATGVFGTSQTAHASDFGVLSFLKRYERPFTVVILICFLVIVVENCIGLYIRRILFVGAVYAETAGYTNDWFVIPCVNFY